MGLEVSTPVASWWTPSPWPDRDGEYVRTKVHAFRELVLERDDEAHETYGEGVTLCGVEIGGPLGEVTMAATGLEVSTVDCGRCLRSLRRKPQTPPLRRCTSCGEPFRAFQDSGACPRCRGERSPHTAAIVDEIRARREPEPEAPQRRTLEYNEFPEGF